MVNLASYLGVLVFSRTQTPVKGLVENLGGSEHICSFSKEIVAPESYLCPWCQQLSYLTHVKSSAQRTLIDIPQFWLIYGLRTLGLLQMKMTSYFHLMPIDVITQTKMGSLLLPTF